MSDLERFMAKVYTDGPTPAHRPELGPCWVWVGGKERRPRDNQYGSFWLNKKTCLAHRAAWILMRGPLTDEQMVCHSCDRPCCVRPDHLFVGDNAANIRDAASKGRLRLQKNPEGSPTLALTAEQVALCRTTLRDVSADKLADEWGVLRVAVWEARVGITWSHLVDPPPIPRTVTFSARDVEVRLAGKLTAATIAALESITRDARTLYEEQALRAGSEQK